jgi:hypothetical protein
MTAACASSRATSASSLPKTYFVAALMMPSTPRSAELFHRAASRQALTGTIYLDDA